MRLLGFFRANVVLLALSYLPCILANTEIVNFGVEPSNKPAVDSIVLPHAISHWPTLSFEKNEQRWNITPAHLGTPITSVCEPGSQYGLGECPHELWLLLDLSAEEWKRYNKFTLRLSWPASSPADFDIQIYDAFGLVNAIENRTPSNEDDRTLASMSSARARYARVRVVDTGVLTPKPSSSSPSTPSRRTPPSVPFALILEPLYFGVLPASVAPTLLLFVPVVVAAILIVPRIITHLEGIALEARLESVEKHKDD